MSSTKEVTIWCDVSDCQNWSYGDGFPCRTVAEARKSVRQLGWDSWQKDGITVDRCPKCRFIGKMP
jgi:hypothetical protein